MHETEISDHRIKRLGDLSAKLGGNNFLGQALGLKSGAYIGQMRRGERPITEKFIGTVEKKIHGTTGWFDIPGHSHASPGHSLATDVESQSRLREMEIQEIVIELGKSLSRTDEYRRNAIGELLLSLARNPQDSEIIGTHIAALLASVAKRAA